MNCRPCNGVDVELFPHKFAPVINLRKVVYHCSSWNTFVLCLLFLCLSFLSFLLRLLNLLALGNLVLLFVRSASFSFATFLKLTSNVVASCPWWVWLLWGPLPCSSLQVVLMGSLGCPGSLPPAKWVLVPPPVSARRRRPGPVAERPNPTVWHGPSCAGLFCRPSSPWEAAISACLNGSTSLTRLRCRWDATLWRMSGWASLHGPRSCGGLQVTPHPAWWALCEGYGSRLSTVWNLMVLEGLWWCSRSQSVCSSWTCLLSRPSSRRGRRWQSPRRGLCLVPAASFVPPKVVPWWVPPLLEAIL